MMNRHFITIEKEYYDELIQECEELREIKSAISKAFLPDYYYNDKKEECIQCEYKTYCENNLCLDCRFAEILAVKIDTLIKATKKYALYDKDVECYDLENAVIEITQILE